MRQWTGSSLVQAMACCPFGAISHSLNLCWFIVNWTPGKKFQWNLNLNFIIFIQEKKMHLKMSSAKMAAILSRERWVERKLGNIMAIVHISASHLCFKCANCTPLFDPNYFIFMKKLIKSGILNTLKFHLHTLSCHFWLNLRPLLMMPWLLVSPGYQQPWYWLCMIHKFMSSKRNDFNCLHHLSLRNDRNAYPQAQLQLCTS